MILLILACTSSNVPAEDGDTTQLPGRSDQTRKRLAQAETTLRDGDATTATNQIQQILDEAGADWIEVETGHFLPARTIAQQLLARLPASALQRYRDRIDAPAKKLLDAGLNANDPEPLRRLVERYSVSRHAEAALLRLGDLALERGDTREAINYWTRLQSDANAYPDAEIEPAQRQARIILARILQGDQNQAEAGLKQLQTDYPNAMGHIAGTDGKLATTLQTLIDNPPKPIADNPTPGWPSFARTPERVNRVASALPYYWPDRPSWQVRFPSAALTHETATAWQTAFHPVVLNGVAYVAVAGQVLGYDIKTGRLLHQFNIRSDSRLSTSNISANVPVERPQRITLTTSDNHIYARLGNPQITNNAESMIVEFDTNLMPKQYLTPPKSKGAEATWEGAPLRVNGRLYALFVRFDGTRLTHLLACYDDPSGDPQWVRPLCDALLVIGLPREQHLLLSYADGNILFASHSGVIVATHAETGEPAWAVRYPSSSKPVSPYRSLPPPVASEGRVFVAPVDSERILALDAETGKTLWQSQEMEVEQLLGVSRGRLIVTIRKPNRGIRGFDTATGSDREPQGWRVHDDPLLQTFGLGMVSQELTLWPTSYGTFVIRSDNGTLIRQPMRGVRGNIIFSDGVLLVATPTGLQGYVSDDVVMPGPISQIDDAKSIFVTEQSKAGLNQELAPARPTIANPPRWTKPIRLLERTTISNPAAMPLPAKTTSDSPLSVDEPFLFITPSTLYRYDLGSRQIRWSVPFPAHLSVATMQFFEDAILLIGWHGLAIHDLADGQWRWQTSFHSSSTQPYIDAVQWVGPQILARVNESHLIAWDDRTGQLNWVRDSLNRARLSLYPLPNAPRFSDSWAAVGDTLFMQNDLGAMQQLELGQGMILSKQTTFPQPWQSPPIPNTADTIIYPTAPGTIECHSVVTGQQLWTKPLAGVSSWRGPMPQMRRVADELFVAVALNHGVELSRLDVETGQSTWPDSAVLLSVNDVDLKNMAWDTTQIYLSTTDALVAIDRRQGTIAWCHPWPPSIDAEIWKLIVGQHALLAYPSVPILIDSIPSIVRRLFRLLWSHDMARWLPLVPWSLYDAWMSRTLPMLQIELDTGTLRQRIDLDDVGPQIDVRIGTDRLALASTGQVHWLSTD